MNIPLRTNLIKISTAMLLLFSMALFVVPAQEVAAQAGGNLVDACFNATTNTLSAMPASKACPSGSYKVTATKAALGFCLLKENGVNVAKPPYMNDAGTGPRLSADGKTCLSENGQPTYGTFKPFPTAATTPPINANTNANNNSNANSNSGGNSGGTIPTTQGDCEDKFHKVGPLCVPDNPFNDDSIAGGNVTASEIAMRIIRIMLYFAGIVAVIMAIIGGYRVMTAQGNEAQAATGRKTLTNALIGLAITVLAYMIVQVVLNFITK